MGVLPKTTEESSCKKSMKVDFASGEEQNGSIYTTSFGLTRNDKKVLFFSVTYMTYLPDSVYGTPEVIQNSGRESSESTVHKPVDDFSLKVGVAAVDLWLRKCEEKDRKEDRRRRAF